MQRTATDPVLEVRDLSVDFGPVQAVSRASFDILPSQTLGLVGQSGSGKTTTGRAVLQLLKATSGSVRLLGQDLINMKRGPLRAMRLHMQFVLQNPYSSLHPRMTIGQTLAEPLQVHRSVPPNQIKQRITDLLELVSMDPGIVHRYPHEFSGGQRQRIVIARALAVNPDFVVCDEPVSALDVRTQAQIVDLLGSLQQRLGMSYLFIAHDLAIVREVAHRVAVMYDGQIVEIGDTAQVYNTPSHPYTRMLLDAVPIPDPFLQRERLRRAPPDMRFDTGHDGVGPCCFGEDHGKTGTPPMHVIAGSHSISCRFIPDNKFDLAGAR